TTYNAVLPSLSTDGTSFFYVNPLQRRTHGTWQDVGEGERAPWYACACCPPNLMRSIGSWHQMLATTTSDGVRVWQYASAEIAAGDLRLNVETGYPWDGTVRIEILGAPDAPRAIALRVPEWSSSASLHEGAGGVGAAVGRRDAAAIVETRRWQA